MKTIDPHWFNFSHPFFRVFGQNIKLFNAFNRKYIQGETGLEHRWGVGLLQINTRHLFYLGWVRNPTSGGRYKKLTVYLFFVCLTDYQLPFDRIHDITVGYARLIIPLQNGGIALVERKELRDWNGDLLKKYSLKERIRRVDKPNYHNCRQTGRY